MNDALTARLKTRLAAAVTKLDEALRIGRVLSIQCRYQRSADERNAWYGQISILEPSPIAYELLMLQSDINVFCERLAGRPDVGIISIRQADGRSGVSGHLKPA